MEYCNAGDLSTFIKKKTALPESTCKYFLRQLGLALKYMRSNNVSHFDLKPQNLLLMRHPVITLKVADFGFAQHLKLGQENRTIKGITIFYITIIFRGPNNDNFRFTPVYGTRNIT